MANIANTNRSLGFTTIELIVVIVIIGILSGVSFASLNRSWKQERLRYATRITTQWLEDVRFAAIQQSQDCVIKVISSSATLETDASTNNCTNIVTLKLRDEIENSQILEITYKPTDSTDLITFTPRGTVPKGGEIMLKFSSDIQNRCIGITQPLGIIRQGIDSPSGCNYNTAF